MPKTITIIDPLITGEIKYSNETDPMITIIGFPPAGGWVTLRIIINPTPTVSYTHLTLPTIYSV